MSSAGDRSSLAGAFAPWFKRAAAIDDAPLALRDAVQCAATPPRTWARRSSLIEQGQPTSGLTLLCHGLAIARRNLNNGLQQNVALFAPGDVLDHSGFLLGAASATIVAVTSVQTVTIPQAAADGLLKAHPAFAPLLLRDMAVAAQRDQEWIVNVGRRPAYPRLAHLLCEVRVRLEAAAMVDGPEAPFPLTQADLADTLGLSVVHINRMLQQLRQAGLVELRAGRLTVKDWTGLVKVAGFEPAYLAPRPPA